MKYLHVQKLQYIYGTYNLLTKFQKEKKSVPSGLSTS